LRGIIRPAHTWNLRFRFEEQSDLGFESGTGHKRAGYPRILLGGLFVMSSRNESARALARLQLETPISDDENLLELQTQVADFVREAKRRDPSEPNELVSTVVDTVARDYFRHAILKQRRRQRGDTNFCSVMPASAHAPQQACRLSLFPLWPRACH